MTLSHTESDVAIRCNLCHELVYTMQESSTPPAFKKEEGAKVERMQKNFIPKNHQVFLTRECISGNLIDERKQDSSYSRVFHVVLPRSDDCRQSQPINFPYIKDSKDVVSFFTPIPRTSFDNTELLTTSNASTESVDEHAWQLLEHARLKIAADMAFILRKKQEEWFETVQRTRMDLHILAKSIYANKTNKTESTASFSEKKADSGLFSKRFVGEVNDAHSSKSELGASLARFDSATLSAPLRKPLTFEELEPVTLATRESQLPRSPPPDLCKQALEKENVPEEEDFKFTNEDQIFQTDEDIKTGNPNPVTNRRNSGSKLSVMNEHQNRTEKVSELLSSGIATSFSAMTLAERKPNNIALPLDNSPTGKSVYDVQRYETVGPQQFGRSNRPNFMRQSHEHDEELVLAGAALANAPSHRDKHFALMFKNTHKHAPLKDTKTLALSLPSLAMIPVHNNKDKEIMESIDHEPKTSLPCNENRMVPSLLQALREKNSPSSSSAKRTVGFNVTSSRSSAQTKKPSRASNMAITEDLPPVPLAPSRSLQFEPLEEAAPHALSTILDSPTPDDAELTKVLYFMHHLQNLKICKRTGWYHHRVPEPESISDHMYRMAIMAILLKEDKVDVKKCVMMALIHDLAEARVGDLTPHCKVDKDEKTRRELDAIQFLTYDLLGDTDASNTIFQLWFEYEERQSLESKLVKDLDCFELCLQAYEYEKTHNIEDLQQFWNGAAPKIQHPQIKRWLTALLQKRRTLWKGRGIDYDKASVAANA